MKLCVRLILVVLCFTHAQASLAGERTLNRPNIVYILADDLGYGDLACYGGKIATPHVDRLAKEGLRFTDAHSGSSVCSPTRYGIMTGRYAWRTERLKQGVLAAFDPPVIEAGRLTVAEFLSRQGYSTACIGKWHLGFAWQWERAGGRPPLSAGFEVRNEWDEAHYPLLNQPITGGPNEHGFKYFFGQTAPNQPPYCFLENGHVVGLRETTKKFSRTNRPAELDDAAILPALCAKAVEFIGRQAAAKEPFFLYFALTSPHTPIAPSVRYEGKSGIAPIADFIMETDGAVGEVLAALDRHKLADSTLVIFTSDNGNRNHGVLKKAGHTTNGPLRGHKTDIHEGGHRVPFVVRWPGSTPAAAVSAEPVCLTSLLATCAELLGVPIPTGMGEDSFSILPALRNEKLKQPTHPFIVHQANSGKLAIRKDGWKWIEDGELFDLNNDPAERKDLSREHQGVVEELRGLLKQTRANGRSRPAS